MLKIRKALARSIALATGIVMMATTTIFASPMKDVSTKHWAYSEITEMQRRGLLLTSSQGEFFPNNYVTYFEVSQILAKATGYKDAAVNPDMDPVLKKQINDNYAKQKPVIEAHQKNYTHWQKDANQEIAYLLGRGYLTKEDLGNFMAKSTTGSESKRGVRKQEAAMYLVRILQKAQTAKDDYTTTGFVDEAKIDAVYRPYVAYLKNIGLVNGNLKGEFGPTEPITRATLSKMLIDTLKIQEASVTPPAPESPTDQALEGKFTKMIKTDKSDGSYYIALEIEPGKTPQHYIINPATSIIDANGNSVSLTELKTRIDADSNKGVIAVARMEVVGITEYITQVKLISVADSGTLPLEPKPDLEKPKPGETDKDEVYTGELTGKIYSLFIAPNPKITIQVDDKTQRTLDIGFSSKMYSNLKRKGINLWDLRLNQEVDLNVVKGVVESLDVTKPAPPITYTGSIGKVSINGDEIEMRISYDSSSEQTNSVKTISIPMATQILQGTLERGRNDLKEGMEIVVVYGQDEDIIPEKIIILAK